MIGFFLPPFVFPIKQNAQLKKVLSSTSISGGGTQQSSGHDSNTSLLPGFYLGLGGVYQLNEHWAIQASGRYQYMDGFDLGAQGSSSNLSFDGAYILSLGAMYSF